MRRFAKAPPTPFIDGRESVMSRARANMHAKPEGAEILRSGKRLPRRAIALRHFSRPCAGSRKHLRPRSSMVENRSRRAPTPICVQKPRGPNSLGQVTACPVAPSLSATLPDRAPARESTADPVSRWSKIGCVARPRHVARARARANMYATTEGAEFLRSAKRLPRRAIALGHSPRPCAGSRKHRRPRLSTVENLNRSRRAPTPT